MIRALLILCYIANNAPSTGAGSGSTVISELCNGHSNRLVEDDGGISELLKQLSQADQTIIREALKGARCALLADHQVKEKILHLVARRKRNGDVGYYALRALSRCEVSDAGPDLIELLQKESRRRGYEEDEWLLVEAAGKCGGAAAREIMEEFARSHTSPTAMKTIDASNKYTALEAAFVALGEVGATTSTDALKHGLTDPFYRVRLATLNAIDALGLVCVLKDDLKVVENKDQVESVRDEASRLLSISAGTCPAK